VCNCLLIPPLGMLGAAYATLFSYIVMAGSLYVIVQRFYHVPYEYRRIVTIAIVTAVLFALYSWLNLASASVSSLFLKALLVLAFPILLLGSKFIEPNEITSLKRILHLA
jgi:O-antigen/teichoic acid export membrane protein